MDDLKKYDFSYEFDIEPSSEEPRPAVYLDKKLNKSDGTISDYNKDTSKKENLFKRKVRLFRKLFKLMDGNQEVSEQWMENFIYITLTGYPREYQDITDCYFRYLRDVTCIYYQYYNISSSKCCIKGIFPASLGYNSKITPAQLFKPSTVCEYMSPKGVMGSISYSFEELNLEALDGQFTIFSALAGVFKFSEDDNDNSSKTGYEFKHTDGKTYVLTAISIYIYMVANIIRHISANRMAIGTNIMIAMYHQLRGAMLNKKLKIKVQIYVAIKKEGKCTHLRKKKFSNNPSVKPRKIVTKKEICERNGELW